MNSRLRTIFILVSVTTIFALVLLLNLSAVAAEGSGSPSAILLNRSNTQTAYARTADDFNLTLNIVGNGNVVKKPDKTTFKHGEVVTLTAIADTGWNFIGWSGDLISTTSPIPVTIDKNYNITATFKQSCFQLTLSHNGEGSNPVPTPSNSAGCTVGRYKENEIINLKAEPALHWSVASWTGTANNSSTAKTNTVTMPAASHTVSVSYAPICFSLILNSDPAGGGNIQPTEPNCPSQPTKYLEGTPVGLKATEALGFAFTGWSGALTGTENPTTVTMNSDRSVTANYKLSCHTLSTTHSPPASGSNPTALPTKSESCSTGEYVTGETISLSTEPVSGWRVEKWKGTDNDTSNSKNNTLTFPALQSGSGHVVEVNFIQMPTLQFKQVSYQVNEDGGVASIQVVRSGSTSESVDVRYLTSNGTASAGKDYEATTGRLTFGPDVLLQTFQVAIINDGTKEGTEILNLTLFDISSNAVLGPQSAAELVILDDEGELTLQFQTTTYEAQEISPTLPISITLFPISNANVYVEFRSIAGTATSGVDYLDKFEILRFKPGETVKQVSMKLIDDLLDEPNETVQLQLSNIDGAILGESEAILTIIDNDSPPTLQFSQNEYFAKEGDVTTPISISLSASSAFSVSVNYEVIELSVGRQLAGSIIFAPGEINKVIDIPVSEYQVGDTLNIFLSEAENATLAAPSSVSLIILDKNRSECHALSMTYTGYGVKPITTNMQKSVGCPVGEYVANELIFVQAQPDPGWFVNGWFGTLDNGLKKVENIVRMPDDNHVVSVFYITSAYMPSIANKYITYFEGSQESEPNDTLAEANGPIRSGQDYFGSFSSSSDNFDNYFFHLDSKGSVQIQLVDIPIGRDYNLLLLSSDQDLKGYSGSLKNDDEHISVSDLDPGLYYVSVYFAQGPTSTAKYRLHVVYE